MSRLAPGAITPDSSFELVEYCEHQGNSIDLLTDLVVNSGMTIART